MFLVFPESNTSLIDILAKDAIRNDTIAQLLQQRQENDEREYNRSLNEYRAIHQQPSAQSIDIPPFAGHFDDRIFQ